MQIVSPKPYTYEVMRKDIETLVSEYSFMQVFSIGTSVLGKELMVLRLGTGEKKLFINGAHHGMEWITSLFLMQMLETCARHTARRESLCGYDVFDLFSRVSLYVCPMVNPDGVGFAIDGLPENLAPITRTRLLSYNNESTDFSRWQANANGVDLNHNYDAAFYKGVFMQHKLNIFGPGPTRYSGNEPESEPESRAVADFTRLIRPDVAVAYHTQGRVIYSDFEGRATKKGREMAKGLSSISGYEPDNTEGMASFSGYKDWVIDEFGIPAFTIEAGIGENPLPLHQIGEIYKENLPMMLYVMGAL